MNESPETKAETYPAGIEPPVSRALVATAAMALCGLLGVLIFYFHDAQRRSQESSCMSNLKEQDLAVLIYSQDYDNVLPPAACWMTAVYKYSKTWYVFQCPDLKTDKDSPIPVKFGYAFHSRLSAAPIAAATDPENTVVAYDSVNIFRNACDPFTSLPAPARHRSGNDVSFLDGHTRFVPDDAIWQLQRKMADLKLSPAAPHRKARHKAQ